MSVVANKRLLAKCFLHPMTRVICHYIDNPFFFAVLYKVEYGQIHHRHKDDLNLTGRFIAASTHNYDTHFFFFQSIKTRTILIFSNFSLKNYL